MISLFNAGELAGGSGLARGFCAYVAVFWGVRLGLQGVLDVKEHLTAWWLRLGHWRWLREASSLQHFRCDLQD